MQWSFAWIALYNRFYVLYCKNVYEENSYANLTYTFNQKHFWGWACSQHFAKFTNYWLSTVCAVNKKMTFMLLKINSSILTFPQESVTRVSFSFQKQVWFNFSNRLGCCNKLMNSFGIISNYSLLISYTIDASFCYVTLRPTVCELWNIPVRWCLVLSPCFHCYHMF